MARVLVGGLLMLATLLATGPAWAGGKAPGVFYRYVDSRGVKVLDSQGIPAQYAGHGYEVLNQQGRVIQVVPPAPTAEELQRKQADQAKAEAQAQLLKKYPSLAEVDRAKARRMAELDSSVAVARNSQQALLLQQQQLQGQAAEQERSGRPVPQATLDQIKQIRAERTRLDTRIQNYEQARKQAHEDFAALKTRLEPLLEP
jgi:hypothetical protein